MSAKVMETLRTTLIVAGILVGYGALIFDILGFWNPVAIVGTLSILTGCYFWTKLKNRSPFFILWGFLAPVGLLGISLLSDKTP
jgi:hypothetical protein